MALDLAEIAKQEPKKTNIPRLPEGTYMARISSVVDFGVQEQTDWKTGKPVDPKATVMVTFEIPSETIEVEDDETGEKKKLPRFIGKEYTLSTYERSNLMKMINAVAPGIKSLEELLNKQAMVQVGSTATDKAKVASVMACPGGMEVGELNSEPTYFDSTFPNKELFDKLPQWQQDRVTSALNWKAPEGWDDDSADSEY